MIYNNYIILNNYIYNYIQNIFSFQSSGSDIVDSRDYSGTVMIGYLFTFVKIVDS